MPSLDAVGGAIVKKYHADEVSNHIRPIISCRCGTKHIIYQKSHTTSNLIYMIFFTWEGIVTLRTCIAPSFHVVNMNHRGACSYSMLCRTGL